MFKIAGSVNDLEHNIKPDLPLPEFLVHVPIFNKDCCLIGHITHVNGDSWYGECTVMPTVDEFAASVLAFFGGGN